MLFYSPQLFFIILIGEVDNNKFLFPQVNVTMPAYAFDTDLSLRGEVTANFTHGGPVRGNLTITAIIRPIVLAGRPSSAVRSSSIDQYPMLRIYEPDVSFHKSKFLRFSEF